MFEDTQIGKGIEETDIGKGIALQEYWQARYSTGKDLLGDV